METSPKHAKSTWSMCPHTFGHIKVLKNLTLTAEKMSPTSVDMLTSTLHNQMIGVYVSWMRPDKFPLDPEVPFHSVIKWISASLPPSSANLKPYVVLDVVVEVVVCGVFFPYSIRCCEAKAKDFIVQTYISAGGSSGNSGALSFIWFLSLPSFLSVHQPSSQQRHKWILVKQ